ncbi:unnamed protein product [Ectocarpus fasciculatus]
MPYLTITFHNTPSLHLSLELTDDDSSNEYKYWAVVTYPNGRTFHYGSVTAPLLYPYETRTTIDPPLGIGGGFLQGKYSFIISRVKPDTTKEGGGILNPDPDLDPNGGNFNPGDLVFDTGGAVLEYDLNGVDDLSNPVSPPLNIEAEQVEFEFAPLTPNALSIENKSDVKTPKLEVSDITNYQQAGYTLTNLQRHWSAQLENINTSLQGSAQNFDLKADGGYYHTTYTINLTVNTVFSNDQKPWLRQGLTHHKSMKL